MKITKIANYTIRLSPQWINFFANHPESGMGYQLVDVVFDDNSVQHDCVVLNGKNLEMPNSCKDKKIKEIRFNNITIQMTK